MTETHSIEIKKLTKRYSIFKKINIAILCCVVLLLILILLESLNFIDIPFYEQRLPISHRIFMNTWLGIPYFIIQRKMKKIDNRIIEIEPMYYKTSKK